ncbi:MAG: HslU--HslV peptidase proteolytic subunit, partial [Parvularculaceae bacterium]|nr:HslU--HslV peptidase proteolytic subunit [Parvularculaceae bacterium]
IEPAHGIAAIGSGGDFARAAAVALYEETSLDAEAIVRRAMAIAASICVYTNDSLTIEKIGG